MSNEDESVKEYMEKVKGFLEEKEIIYQENENTLIVPYSIGDLVFNPEIQFHGKWLVVSSLIMKRQDIPDEVYNDLLFDLLLAIHNLPEISYDVDEDGNIFTSVDMRAAITDFDNFFSEFFAVPFGIRHFVNNIAPKFGLTLKQL
ncbi:MAG: hypothetical protein ACTSU5_06520 [Promethearchaeota archaeon]